MNADTPSTRSSFVKACIVPTLHVDEVGLSHAHVRPREAVSQSPKTRPTGNKSRSTSISKFEIFFRTVICLDAHPFDHHSLLLRMRRFPSFLQVSSLARVYKQSLERVRRSVTRR